MSEDDLRPGGGSRLQRRHPVPEDPPDPITSHESIEEHGDLELGRTDGEPISIRELFEYVGDDTSESEEQHHQVILSQMLRQSGGRSGYSDRGGSYLEATAEAEMVGEGTAATVEADRSSCRNPKASRRPKEEVCSATPSCSRGTTTTGWRPY